MGDLLGSPRVAPLFFFFSSAALLAAGGAISGFCAPRSVSLSIWIHVHVEKLNGNEKRKMKIAESGGTSKKIGPRDGKTGGGGSPAATEQRGEGRRNRDGRRRGGRGKARYGTRGPRAGWRGEGRRAEVGERYV